MVVPRHYILTRLGMGRKGQALMSLGWERCISLPEMVHDTCENNCWVSWAREGHGHEGEKIETQS